MAVPPLTYLEQKWAAGRGTSNLLIDSATQNSDRKRVADLDSDFHRNISTSGRRTLATLGRWLFWNCDAVRGAVIEAANYTTETWVAQFEGEDQDWGKEAEAWLAEHNKFCNVRGGNRTFDTFIYDLVVSSFTDGELFTVLTEIDGVPKIQIFPSHRVGSRRQDTLVTDGPFKGRAIIDGAIVNDFAAPIGYRIYQDDTGYSGTYRDVSINDVVPTFMVYSDEQLRGVSLLGASMFNWADATEFGRFEMIRQKLSATIGLIEQNEEGQADTSKRVVTPASPAVDDDYLAQSVATEKVDGVSIYRFRSGTGAGLESFKHDSPTENQREFVDSKVREALAGIGWSWDFSLNPTKAGGAQMRIIVEKVNRNIASIVKHILLPTCRRIDPWRISKAIKSGRLRSNPEWYKWSYQGSAELTADKKYDSDVDMQERRGGITTLRRNTAKRGEYWRDVRSQADLEVDDLLTRAQSKAAKFGIPIETALSLFELITPNGNLPTAAPEPVATEE